MEKMPGEKLAGVMPTSVAISPTRELTESKTPVRLPMIPLIRSSLSHSAIASRILPKSNTLSFHLVGQGCRAPPRPGYSGPCPASVSGGEQPGEQGDQGDTDEGDASARHQLFHSKIGETAHGGRRHPQSTSPRFLYYPGLMLRYSVISRG